MTLWLLSSDLEGPITIYFLRQISSSFLKFFNLLAIPHGIWDLSTPHPPTRDQTHAPCIGGPGVLTTGSLGKPL